MRALPLQGNDETLFKGEEFRLLFLMDGCLPLIVPNLFYKLHGLLLLSYVVSHY